MSAIDGITAEVENEHRSTVASLKSTESGNVAPSLVVDDVHTASRSGKRRIEWIQGALISAGSFGGIYLGMDATNGLLVAVKQIELPTKAVLEALEHSIDLLRELHHENIVQFLDSSLDDMHLNMFFEYMPGGSVAALLHTYGVFEEALCRAFVRQVLQGLDYLHRRDIIHRNIRGTKILIDNRGGVKISGAGISKNVEEALQGVSAHALHSSLQGSVYWMAPEVVKQAALTPKMDIWSVGCLLVEMLTGNQTYPTLSQMQAIFEIGALATPAIPSAILLEVADFLQKTFKVRYQERPDAYELLQHPWIVKGPSSTSANMRFIKTS